MYSYLYVCLIGVTIQPFQPGTSNQVQACVKDHRYVQATYYVWESFCFKKYKYCDMRILEFIRRLLVILFLLAKITQKIKL